MGAIIAGLCAMGHDPATMVALTRRHYAEGGGFDMTLPIVALRSARQTVRTLRGLFGDARIEDLFTPYFCVSADLTRAEVVVHDAGPLWLAVRASCALPGLVPPVAYHGDLLVDGGLLNNLPTDVMRERSTGYVIAVDVSPKVDLTVASDGPAEVSGWPQLWAACGPDAAVGSTSSNSKNGRFPSIVEVLSRSVLLGSVRDSQASGRQADLYLHPYCSPDCGRSARLKNAVSHGGDIPERTRGQDLGRRPANLTSKPRWRIWGSIRSWRWS